MLLCICKRPDRVALALFAARLVTYVIWAGDAIDNVESICVSPSRYNTISFFVFFTQKPIGIDAGPGVFDVRTALTYG